MSADNVFLVFFSLLVILLCSAEETQVSCVFNENCVLPCSFQNGSDPVIHWYKTPRDVPFHSYYFGQDQLSGQNQDFKGRTSLFVDQISRGNASLLLREVKVQDEGTYKCSTSTVQLSEPKESFINLRVRASVSFVNIEQRGDELICSSKDIYPKPDVSWSLRPPPPDVEPKTNVSDSEKGLYSIFSSVPLSHKPPEEHSCNISTDHSWSSATYRLQQTQVSCVFNESCVLPCSFQSGPDPVIYWFKTPGRVPVHIYFYDQDQVQHQDFKDRTSLFVDQISRGNASLLLREVKVQDEGTYECLTDTVTSGNKDSFISQTSFINLRVRASVSFVNIEQRGDELICSSKDIYPKPDVTSALTTGTKLPQKRLHIIYIKY